MGLITKEVEMTWNPNNRKYYENLGYNFTGWKDSFIIRIEHLSKNSQFKIDAVCDNCNQEINISYGNYNNSCDARDGKYYCHNCLGKLFGIKQMKLTKLKNSKSFGDFLIELYGDDAIEKYWASENKISPFSICYGSTTIIHINCLEKSYHGSYSLKCNTFSSRLASCPYCVSRKVHELDSLGTLYPQVFKIWSKDNLFSPYEVLPKSNKKVKWKCHNGLHKDYIRGIDVSNVCNFKCPQCNNSKGEERIQNYLIDNKISFVSQKTFDDLHGVGNGLLSYDFYLPNKLLIEYQGRQHKMFIRGLHASKRDFEKQQEHDRRKRQYAQDRNIKLLEIWYWDFDNIEKILEEKINSILQEKQEIASFLN